MRMTKEAIRLCIKRKELCNNPELVERLYVHNKGFSEIQNLEEYSQVKALYLEGNALTKVNTGLNKQKHLVSLYLHDNKIGEILSSTLWLALINKRRLKRRIVLT